ncbi:hypothetical protein [Halobellus clavatus]|jgi:hypothetical protein|uniref:Halobacterial output domain-containing protein n=1 Tax=Halobellus clavatus TaxID=660517 RepID=A0A1H3F6H0_9EURY|nr:hypothetical protein [Halobellus clavatus]SDX86505.1 hypothetical protein SAMN04487946_103184 [Halobellus clavatus]
MSSTPRTSTAPNPADSDPIATYVWTGEEDGANAVVAAFSEGPLDGIPTDNGTLYQWIDTDAIDSLLASAHDDVELSTVIWDHPVVITRDTVEVYAQRER